jgi:hypothetical protein
VDPLRSRLTRGRRRRAMRRQQKRLSQGAKWYVITYHLIVSARNYAYGGDISESGVHTIKLREYIPLLVCR